MIGLVLCGGGSSRMGSDKGLLKQSDQSWAEIAMHKLNEFGMPVFFSIRTSQMTAYGHFLTKEQVIPDNEALAYRGPLLGIMSAHLVYPNQDLFVLACDMPELSTALLFELNELKKNNPMRLAYCFSNKGQWEPLTTIYTSKGLSLIHELYLAQLLPTSSMKYVLDTLNAINMPLADNQIAYFKNFNSPTDLVNL